MAPSLFMASRTRASPHPIMLDGSGPRPAPQRRSGGVRPVRSIHVRARRARRRWGRLRRSTGATAVRRTHPTTCALQQRVPVPATRTNPSLVRVASTENVLSGRRHRRARRRVSPDAALNSLAAATQRTLVRGSRVAGLGDRLLGTLRAAADRAVSGRTQVCQSTNPVDRCSSGRSESPTSRTWSCPEIDVLAVHSERRRPHYRVEPTND